MNFLIYGLDFKHKQGEFCSRTVSKLFFVSCFRTDFLTEIDGRLVRGHAGDVLIARPGDVIYHGPTPEMEHGFSNDWINIEGDDFSALLDAYPLPINRPFHTAAINLVSTAIERIHRERSFSLDGYAQKCDMIMTDMVIELWREYKSGERLTPHDKLERARGEIMRDFKRDWSLDVMADLAGYSPSRFSALYKSTYGRSPVDDLINTRLENAKLLLLYSNMTVNDIAEAVGFSSIYYFSKHFKKKEGLSPLAFKGSI